MTVYNFLLRIVTYSYDYLHLIIIMNYLKSYNFLPKKGGVMAKVVDCSLEVREFNFHYVHFWTNTLEKGINILILPAMG